jgi:uncharacterized protein (DUF1501 family)
MKGSRRSFLKKLVLSGVPQSDDAGAQTLVCVFLRGGADTLNMFVPYGDLQYYKVRPTLAIPAPGKAVKAALKLDEFYALHPELAPLLPVWASGELGAVQAVGTDNPSGSHFEVQDQMEHGEAYGKTIGGGWLGRYLRQKSPEALTPLSAVAVGCAVPESFRGAPVASVFHRLEEISMTAPSGSSAALCQALSAMYAGAATGLLSSSGRTALDLLKRVERLRAASYKPDNGAVYADDEFSEGLREIARLAKAEVGLSVAFIDLNGWDTHFVQGAVEGQQAVLIKQLAAGLSAFWKDLGKLNRQVTTLVMTEFGRRTYENGSLGTDHGRGAAFMLMGAGVKGGKVYGSYPGLQDDQYELGPGGLKITCDYRHVLSEVLSYNNAVVHKIFPDFKAEPTGIMKAGSPVTT